jgi:SOS-response transcriptional repressor LexA
MANAKKILDAIVAYMNLKNYADLANFLGVAPSTISTWIARGRVNEDKIFRLCKGVRYEWLLTGEGPMLEPGYGAGSGNLQPLSGESSASTGQQENTEPSNVSPAPPEHHKPNMVPLISWVQAGGWEYAADPFQPGDADRWLDTTATKSKNAFALTVHGDSMEPEFTEGDIIIVDPEREPVSGSYIIAKNGAEATFKQFVMDGQSVLLKPLNGRYPIRDMTGIEFRVVGVVVEKRKRY